MLGLDETTIPGGRYLRLRLIGDAPGVYGQIAAAFNELFEHADHDPTRPLIEFYRREGEIDCLVPVNAAAVPPASRRGTRNPGSGGRRSDSPVVARRLARPGERSGMSHERLAQLAVPTRKFANGWTSVRSAEGGLVSHQPSYTPPCLAARS